MPVFVGHNHFLNNLLNVLIGGFHWTIYLRSIQRKVAVFNLELRAELCDHSIVQISTIIRDNPFGDAIPIYDVMLNEPVYHILCDRGK